MDLQKQYNELLKHRKQQSINIVTAKKRQAWEYFRRFVSVNNLEENINKNFTLFYAPLRQIRDANMVCWAFKDGSKEIYIDETFASNNPQITKIQITHEVLHALSQMKNGSQICFSHQYQDNQQSIYTGIDEATTQLFTEEIEQHQLNENEDYLYFGKNIMRVMKVLFGTDKLADQYLNNNNNFELSFNKLTNGKFVSFASIMNEVYNLNKNKHYNKLSEEEKQLLEVRKEQVMDFTKSLVNTFKNNNPQLIKQIIDEIKDEEILNKLDIKTNKIAYAYYLHGTSNDSPEALEDIFNNGLILNDMSLALHSTLAPISDEDRKKFGLEHLMTSYVNRESFNSVFLIKIPKEYLSCKPHRDGSVDIPMPLLKNQKDSTAVLTPHLIKGVYNKRMNKSITNPNFCPLYDPNGMAYSNEQFNAFASYNRLDLMNEYKQRQLTSFKQQYASDKEKGVFTKTINYYQNKFGQVDKPQLFDCSEYKKAFTPQVNSFHP